MPVKKKGKAKKSKSRPSIKKAAKKKTSAKKAAKRTTSGKAAKKNAKTAGRRKTVTPTIVKEAVLIEPGPPSMDVPPVEEPTATEEAVGTVTHYYSHLGVAIVQVNNGMLSTGSRIHVKGNTTDFIQQIESMEYEHQHVDQAEAGQVVGLKVKDSARAHDIVFRIR